MRTIKLPDLSNHIEDDTYLDTAIRKELAIDPECNFEFAAGTPEYNINRFKAVVDKVNFWSTANNRNLLATVSVAQPYVAPEPVVVKEPEPVVAEEPVEVLPELAPIVEEPITITTKKKKNG